MNIIMTGLEYSSTHSTDSDAREHAIFRKHSNLVPNYFLIKIKKQQIFSHFDSRTVDFLRRVSALFTGVNLNFYKFGFEEDLPKLRTILDHLSPLIHGIHSITFDHLAIPLMEQHFGEKLAHIKVLRFNLDTDVEQPAFEATIQAAINYCLNWLTSGERDSTEPKLLELESFEPGFGIFQQISAAVQQVVTICNNKAKKH